uniref:NRDE-2, necessary for RNA interference, domain containing n=1 Tax=Leptobrachium leishanense TaxID=445787 RepID=A0A8C5R346_9ANUR
MCVTCLGRDALVYSEGAMALFPAFADTSGDCSTPANTELDWLSNKSFCTEDALSLHQRALQPAPPARPLTPRSSRSPSPPELSAGSQTESKTSGKKKKKKKKKKLKKSKRHDGDSEDGSIGDTGSISGLKKSEFATAERKDTQISGSGRWIWLDEAQSVTEETFRIDKKSDPANWEYKSLYRGDIARYRRRGNSCLGINAKKQQIIWEVSATDKTKPRKKDERYFAKSAIRSLRCRGESVSRPQGGTEPETPIFIPVSLNDKDCPNSSLPTSWVNPLGVYDASTALWLEGKGGLKNDEPQPAPRDTGLLSKIEDYNRRLRESPGDVHAWMEFVSFQDELIRQPSMYSTSEGEVDSHRMSVKLLLEKKLSILERAIESNPSSTELKLARLKLCEEFWEVKALLKEWQKLVFLHPNDPKLWQKYLQFFQSQFSSFSVSKVNAAYGKCISTLAAVEDGSMRSHPALPGTERSMFDLFIQQCHFLRQTGHTEKSVSMFQALIDFTFYKPDSVRDMSTKEQVQFFEPFWDSGEPRFGENGAKGWSAWMRQQERGGWITISNLGEDDEEDPDEEFDLKDKSSAKYKIWLDVECTRESRHWLPWRPDSAKKETEEDCEDPERQVLFDELGPSMIKISSPSLQFQLILSFLQFLGVPCGPRLSEPCLYLSLDDTSIFDHIQPCERLLTSFELPLSGVCAVGRLDAMSRSRQQMAHCKEGENFIQNIFQAAISLYQGEKKMTLSVCWLQYEISKVVWCLHAKKKKKLKSQGKRSKRLAKSLLKESSNRTCLALWKEYALLEWLLGNIDDSRKVFDTAVSSAGGKGLKNLELCSLCMLYAELEGETEGHLEGGVGYRAIHVLTSLTESTPYVPYTGPVQAIRVLKARKLYENALQCCARDSAPGLHCIAGCFALFQYLTVSIDAAVTVFVQAAASCPPPDTQSGQMQDSCSPLQAVTVMHANLLRYHTKVGVYPLTPLRDHLTASLKLYPTNVSLWKTYIQTESRCHNASKARRFLDGVRRTTDALEPRLFAIQAEENRMKLMSSAQSIGIGEVHSIIPETGLSNRIRALFEHALRSEYGSRCPLLWRMYLHFTVSLGHRERSRGLFYKAIQTCPWVKVLYMDAVEYFPDQLQETIDLMTEKELRVRVPLEELDLLLED